MPRLYTILARGQSKVMEMRFYKELREQSSEEDISNEENSDDDNDEENDYHSTLHSDITSKDIQGIEAALNDIVSIGNHTHLSAIRE